jgi:hypothetical protein
MKELYQAPHDSSNPREKLRAPPSNGIPSAPSEVNNASKDVGSGG